MFPPIMGGSDFSLPPRVPDNGGNDLDFPQNPKNGRKHPKMGAGIVPPPIMGGNRISGIISPHYPGPWGEVPPPPLSGEILVFPPHFGVFSPIFRGFGGISPPLSGTLGGK